MPLYRLLAAAALAAHIALASPTMAAPGDPIELGEDISLDIIANARIRYESVDQENAVGDADALTIRGRAGVVLAGGGFEFLAEAEGTAALADDYNDTLPGNGVEPFSVVADPENLELNRLQLSFMDDGNGGTVGRQRIIMGNARFVGNVGWRQNEQTFDSLRGQFSAGPVTFDGAFAISQRTIFGNDSPNEHFDGDITMLSVGLDLSPVNVAGFAYVVDYDTRLAFSSQTYGLTAAVDIPLGGTSLKLTGTYASQSDVGANPTNYQANFINLQASTSIAGFNLAVGYEELGSDGGVAAFQTPLATVHAFQGWADVFLVTPANGVRDHFATVKRQIAVPGLTAFEAAVTYHQFDSDFGGLDYGSEWDASLSFRLGRIGLQVKYANYNSSGFSVDTQKLWLQAGYNF